MKNKGSNSSVLLHLQLESCNVCSQLMLQCAHTARLKVGSLPRPSHLRFDVMAVKKFDASGGRGAPQNLGLFCHDEPLQKYAFEHSLMVCFLSHVMVRQFCSFNKTSGLRLELSGSEYVDVFHTFPSSGKHTSGTLAAPFGSKQSPTSTHRYKKAGLDACKRL